MTKIGAQFSAVHTTEWVFTSGRYHNTNSNAPARDQFLAANVLVLRVREGDAGYLDPAGNHVPVTLLKGSGNALLFHDGRMVAATWHKGKAPASTIKLTTKKGSQAPGPRRPHLDRAGPGPRRQRHLLEEAVARPMS